MFRKEQMEFELNEELRFHLEKEIEQNMARGLSYDEARLAALRSFGGVEQVKEQARDVRGVRFFEELSQDLRYGLRMMRRSPVFTATAVLSLALGIGANTALFSIAYGVLLKTLPVKEPNQLVLLEWQSTKTFRTTGVNGYGVLFLPLGMRGSSSFHQRMFDRMRAQPGALSDVFAFADLWRLNIQIDGLAEVEDGQLVSGNYFAELGVPAQLGRVITTADDDATATPVAMVSYQYWQDHFASDQGAIGKQFKLNGVSFTLVGVTPPEFRGTLQVGGHPAVTVPLAFEPVLSGEHARVDKPGKLGPYWLHLMGRLKPNATFEQAQQSLNPLFQQTALELMPPPEKENEPAQIQPKDYPTLLAISGSRGMTEARQEYSYTVYLLFGVAGLVLLIACANVANLLLARATLRSPEITVRLAVGAGRWRIVRQLLTESVLLSLIAGLAGLLFAIWGKDILRTLGGKNGSFLPAGISYELNWWVLGFTVVVSLFTGMLFGIAPAWRATSQDMTTSLKESNRSSTGLSRSRLSKTLVMLQVAVSLMLLTTAGLFVRTLLNLQAVDVGFNQDKLLTFSLQPSLVGYKGERLEQFYRDITTRLDALPGVSSATFGQVPLLAHLSNDSELILPGETAHSGGEHFTNVQVVRENYHATMEIPVVRGRGFTERDDRNAQKVIVVSETIARKFFPGEDPIGKLVGLDEKTAGKIEIVGVARNIKYHSQDEEDEPLLYVPWAQAQDDIGGMSFAVRTMGDASSVVPSIREAVREVDNTLPLTNVATQVEQSANSLTQQRLFARLMSFFALLVTLLSAIGLYGVMAYSVAQRTIEIGIRMALGAKTADVLRLVVWQGLKLVLVGLTAGTFAAVSLKKIVESRLFGVKATDPLTFVVMSILLLIVALAACLIPARRAARIDPMIALRNE